MPYLHSSFLFVSANSFSQAARAREPVMHSTDENQLDALIFTGVGNLFTAIAAVLLEYPIFAAVFAFFSAFALGLALRNAQGGG